MGVLYTVVPLEEQIADYLLDVGATVPGWTTASRNPTPREIRTVCTALLNLKIEMLSPPVYAWQVMIEGLRDPENEPWTILNVDHFNGDENAPHSIWFEKGWPSLILRIVNALSSNCGPLVIIPDTGCTPIVVSTSDDVGDLLSTWEHTHGCDR